MKRKKLKCEEAFVRKEGTTYKSGEFYLGQEILNSFDNTFIIHLVIYTYIMQGLILKHQVHHKKSLSQQPKRSMKNNYDIFLKFNQLN